MRSPIPGGRRVAHLSDIHVVGDAYGFRIESGRAGPRGDQRLDAVLARLDAIQSAHPVDHVLITGDMTDAGRTGEWAAFLAASPAAPAWPSERSSCPETTT